VRGDGQLRIGVMNEDQFARRLGAGGPGVVAHRVLVQRVEAHRAENQQAEGQHRTDNQRGPDRLGIGLGHEIVTVEVEKTHEQQVGHRLRPDDAAIEMQDRRQQQTQHRDLPRQFFAPLQS